MSVTPAPLNCLRSFSLDLSSADDSMFEKSSTHITQASPRDPPKFAPAEDIYDLWNESRKGKSYNDSVAPGGQRSFSRANIRLASRIIKSCGADLMYLLWGMHPSRTTAMMLCSTVRGLLPAFKGYSQALILNEIQTLLTSEHFTLARLGWLLGREISRMAFESILDSIAQQNEAVVNSSAQFVVEYQQISLRARLDAPALADCDTRDLLQESDLFVGSFAGLGGFGILSPLELIRGFALLTELLAHLYILFTLTISVTHLGILAFSLIMAFFPLVGILSRVGVCNAEVLQSYGVADSQYSEKQLKMRSLVYGEGYRSEVLLFGLSSWIVDSWASARRAALGLSLDHSTEEPNMLQSILTNTRINEIAYFLQNLPLFLFFQASSSHLGSVALYHNSIQSLLFTGQSLAHMFRTGFSSIFLMGAFCAAIKLEPKLKPSQDVQSSYVSKEKGGVKLEARGLTYTYPGALEPALKGVSFELEAGETLAIVGCNGSGKSTLANIILRLQDFDNGELRINGTDIRHLDPAEYHSHLTATMQNFVRYEASARDNVGVGFVSDLRSRTAVERAMALGGADQVVGALPRGLNTMLDSMGTGGIPHLPCPTIPGFPAIDDHFSRQGLSGGEWQRIAISRAFMRAHREEVDLMVFDEPTSALDSHAQARVFETIEQLSHPASGVRRKTVIFITHRMAIARRADKIIMLDNGSVSECGSHDELMANDGPYASMYRASI